jgi:hypothetical protein
MSNTEITYLVGGCAGAFGLIAYVSLILVPAWNSYSRLWERAAATFLSLYVVAAMAGIGVGGGLLVIYYWDRL